MDRTFAGDEAPSAPAGDAPSDAASSARPPVRLWDLILPVIVGVALPFIVAVVVGIGVGLNSAKAGVLPDSVRDFFTGLSTNFVVAQVFTAVIYLAMLGLIWLVARREGPATVSGYFAPVSSGTKWLGAIGGIILAGMVLGAIVWIDQHTTVKFHTTQSEEALLAPHSPLQLAVALVVIAVIAPFVEELYFRGLLLAWLRRYLWLPFAALADAALFALVHGRYINHPGLEGWTLTVMVATVGLVNVLWYARTKSLWPAFLTHMFYNGTLLTLAYFGGNM